MVGIVSAKREFIRHLIGNPRVKGVAVGDKATNGHSTHQPAIVVFVEKKMPLGELPRQYRIPSSFGRYPTDVVEFTPDIRACSCEADEPGLGESCRPLRGGTLLSAFHMDPQCQPPESSHAHEQIYGNFSDSLERGTLGCMVKHLPSGKICALTNQHVVTSIIKNVSYDLTGNGNPDASARQYTGVSGWQGFPALDPSEFSPETLKAKKAYDKKRTCCYWLCGAAEDPPPIGMVFKVADEPIDAALVALTGGLEYTTDLAGGIAIQEPLALDHDGLASLVGTEVIKRGNSTHLTTGIIEHVDLAIDPFNDGQNCQTANPPMIVIRPTKSGSGNGDGYFEQKGALYFVIHGDSGALLLRKSDNRVLGLCCGGTFSNNPTSGDVFLSYAVDIKRVIDALNIKILTGGGGTPQTVPNSNLDGVTSRSYRGSPALMRSQFERAQLWTVRKHVSRTLRGRESIRAFQDARTEIAALIDRYRKIRIAWNKNHGPTLGWHLRRVLLDGDAAIPSHIEGHNTATCVDNIISELMQVSTERLRKDLGFLRGVISDLPGMNRDAMFARLGVSPWHD